MGELDALGQHNSCEKEDQMQEAEKLLLPVFNAVDGSVFAGGSCGSLASCCLTVPRPRACTAMRPGSRLPSCWCAQNSLRHLQLPTEIFFAL